MMNRSPDPEMEQFQADLLESVRQMKAGQTARIIVVAYTEVVGTGAPPLRRLIPIPFNCS